MIDNATSQCGLGTRTEKRFCLAQDRPPPKHLPPAQNTPSLISSFPSQLAQTSGRPVRGITTPPRGFGTRAEKWFCLTQARPPMAQLLQPHSTPSLNCHTPSRSAQPPGHPVRDNITPPCGFRTRTGKWFCLARDRPPKAQTRQADAPLVLPPHTTRPPLRPALPAQRLTRLVLGNPTLPYELMLRTEKRFCLASPRQPQS